MQLVLALKLRLLAVILALGLLAGAVGPAYAAPAEAPNGFDVQAFLERHPGPLKSYSDGDHRASQIIQGYGIYYNLDPRIILTLLELVPQLLTTPSPPPELLERPFGNLGPKGFRAQIDWLAREVRAGFGPYEKAPEVRFSDGSTETLALSQDPSLIAVQRFLSRGRSKQEWASLRDRYPTLFRELFGA